jgi:glycosyltransferase involved in cell wall biosynthesis
VQLAIVGRVTKLSENVVEIISKSKNRENIKLLGYVPDDDLSALYAGAYAFIFPSLYEGFGLPPLEAMASGCPTLVSNTSSLPEVCGNAAYYFDPHSAVSIAEAITKVLDSRALQQELIIKGLARAKLFSFEKTAEHLIRIIKRVLQ